MVDIILEIERHSVLRMQIGYLVEIEKFLSLSIPLFLSLTSSRELLRYKICKSIYQISKIRHLYIIWLLNKNKMILLQALIALVIDLRISIDRIKLNSLNTYFIPNENRTLDVGLNQLTKFQRFSSWVIAV